VIAMPPDMILEEEVAAVRENDPDGMTSDRLSFWSEFVKGLSFDDPDQPIPKVSKQGYVYVSMPVPSGSCWLTVFRNVAAGRVGIFLSYTRDTVGSRSADASSQNLGAK
jgi:hypothetical protein